MKNKYDEHYEHQIVLLAQTKVESEHYKVFDNDLRFITKRNFPNDYLPQFQDVPSQMLET